MGDKTCTGADADAGDFNLRGRFRPRLRGDSRRRVSEHDTQEKNKEKKRQGDCGTKWLPARYGQWLVHGTHPTTAQRSRLAAPLPRPGPAGYHTPGLSRRSTQPQMVAYPGSASKQLGNLYPRSFRQAAPATPRRPEPSVRLHQLLFMHLCISTAHLSPTARTHPSPPPGPLRAVRPPHITYSSRDHLWRRHTPRCRL
jgi:hypothetical protein